MSRPVFKPVLASFLLLLFLLASGSQSLMEEPVTVQNFTASAGAVYISVTRIDLPTNDLIYDPVRGKIYASTPSTAGTYGNQIVPIDVPTGTLGSPTYVGSEPNRLAISDDGQYLYVGLDGAGAVRRVNLTSQTPDIQFSLGSNYCGIFRAEDMVVLAGNPSTVAVSRRNTGCSPRHEGVVIYDNGVARPTSTPGHTGSNVIEPSASPDILYGYNNETTEFGFRIMSVDSSGVKVTSVNQGLISGFGTDIRFDNGLVYATSGRVINPSTLTLVGTYNASGPVCPDSPAGRVYFLSNYGSIRLRIFDQSTFVYLGEVTIPTASGTPGSFIKAGENVLAFRTTAGQVFLLQFKDLSYRVFLPLVSKPCSTGICGRVTLNGAPAARELTAYTAGSAVEIGNFDIADIALVAPYDGATVSLPYTFQWTPRPATPSDSYALAIYDPNDPNRYAYTSPLGYVGSINVTHLPPFVQPGVQYRWEVLAFSPDGGIGISLHARRVAFTNTGTGSASDLSGQDFTTQLQHILEDRAER